MIAGQPFPGGEEHKKTGPVEHQAGKPSPKTAFIIIFNMLLHQGMAVVYRDEAVGVLPMFERALMLGVGKSCFTDIGMNGRPGNGYQSEPHG